MFSKFSFFIATFLFSSIFLSAPSFADLAAGSCSDAQKTQKSVTQSSASIGSQTISYTATASYLEVTAADGKSKACIFYVSYVVQPAPGAVRPVTFAFNGGPGSAALFLHMGVIGPQRVDLGSDGLTSYDPFKLINNQYSLIDISDYVLIDPVATGFSDAEGDASTDKFFGVKNDYMSVAAFIQNYLDATNRWNSPKYVMGESYGGVRGALLAHHLQSDLGIDLAGVVFVSPFLTTTTLNFGDADNDLPYVTFLPSFATTAWYHNKASSQLQAMPVSDVLTSAEAFARGRYWTALQQGDDLADSEFHAVAQIVSQYTGLPQATVENLNLRVADTDYFSGLLQSTNQVVGRYDARFVGGRLPSQSGGTATDPSDATIASQYNAAVNYYLRGPLNFLTASPYVSAANIMSWPFNSDGQEYGVMDDLSQALIDNANLKIYVASGIYDLAVPYETVKYNFEHLAPRLDLGSRVTITTYPAGHMVYINPTALSQLKTELTQFYAN